MHKVGVLEILSAEEEGLQAFLGTGDDGSVVAEQQSAQYGHQHNAVKVATIDRIYILHS